MHLHLKTCLVFLFATLAALGGVSARFQNGVLSNLGVALPTGGSYFRQGGKMLIQYRCDHPNVGTNTEVELLDKNDKVVETIIPRVSTVSNPVIGYTTSYIIPKSLPTGTYSMRWAQHYTFSGHPRSQTLELEIIVLRSNAVIPTPTSRVIMNTLGLTVTVPRYFALSPATVTPIVARAPVRRATVTPPPKL